MSQWRQFYKCWCQQKFKFIFLWYVFCCHNAALIPWFTNLCFFIVLVYCFYFDRFLSYKKRIIEKGSLIFSYLRNFILKDTGRNFSFDCPFAPTKSFRELPWALLSFCACATVYSPSPLVWVCLCIFQLLATRQTPTCTGSCHLVHLIFWPSTASLPETTPDSLCSAHLSSSPAPLFTTNS